MKTYIIILISILSTICAAQELSWQLNYISKPNYGLRGAFDIKWKIDNTRYSYGLDIPPIAISKSENDKDIKIASNYLLIAPGLILNAITKDRVYFIISALIIGLPNMHLSYALLEGSVYFTLAQRTDFYIFRKDSKIFSALSLGLLVKVNNFALRPNYSLPISKGYFKDSNPYFGIDLEYYINSDL